MKKFIYLALLTVTSVYSCKTVSKIDRPNVEQSMVRALEWQEANPIFAKAPTDWTNGAYYTGVAEAHKATKNVAFLSALNKMANNNKWETYNRFYHADVRSNILCLSLFKIYQRGWC